MATKKTAKKKIAATPKKLIIHLDELKGFKLPPEVAKMVKKDALNGKGFEACHKVIRAQSGIWIPELNPIFKKLDKMLGLPRPA
ncbi:MAG: hypothetical protein H0U18_13920 [Pyrinomonadaceae bacterium]|jgi:hypothetical protein|nr:hypothetical protein [Pyrinomonadaceae bacterium]